MLQQMGRRHAAEGLHVLAVAEDAWDTIVAASAVRRGWGVVPRRPPPSARMRTWPVLLRASAASGALLRKARSSRVSPGGR